MTAATTRGNEGEIRTFGLLLQGLEDGQFIADLDDKLREVVTKIARVAAAQGKAKGVLTIKLSIAGDQGGTVQIDGEIATKDPKPARARSVRWITKSGDLSAENPKQTKLPLREVARPADDPRDVTARGDGGAR